MPTTRNTTDLDILRELIDCLHLHDRKKDLLNPSNQGSAVAVCLSTNEVRRVQETRHSILEKLERGMCGLSYHYLGIKLGIAVALAKEARGEGLDGGGLREQLENALACADGEDVVAKGEDVEGVHPVAAQGRRQL